MGAGYGKKQASLIGGRGTGNVGANLTRYYNPSGSGPLAAELQARMRVPFDCIVNHLNTRSVNPPGVGETYVYTLMVNGIASAMTVTCVNPNEIAGPSLVPVALAAQDDITIRLVTSAAAAVSEHLFSFEVNT